MSRLPAQIQALHVDSITLPSFVCHAEEAQA